MASDIRIESGVSAERRDGFVVLRWGSESGQLTPEEARQHALAILGAADAAEHDAAAFNYALAAEGWDLRKAAAFIAALREFRQPR